MGKSSEGDIQKNDNIQFGISCYLLPLLLFACIARACDELLLLRYIVYDNDEGTL